MSALEDLQKFGLKLFATDGADVRPRQLVPLFHRWIQTGAVPRHLLIDVADYQHVPDGPGVLLVSHQANFSLDHGHGRMGWLYLRKQPQDGSLAERLRAAARSALQTAQLLEQEPTLEGRLRFRADEIEVVANDRLRAPNDEASREAFEPAVRELAKALYGDAACTLTPQADARERLGFTVKAPRAGTIGDLLGAL